MAGWGFRVGVRSRFGVCPLLLCLALGLAAAPPARAGDSPGFSVFGGLGFRVPGTNGYSISVSGVPAFRDKPASVSISVSAGRVGADYTAPATITADSIEADLGALGRIEVSRRPSGETRTVRAKKCGGKTFTIDPGIYEGTMEFHGELGYTDAEAAGGDMHPLVDYGCVAFAPVPSQPAGKRPPGAELEVTTRGETRLRLKEDRPGARASVEAGVFEKREGIEIERFVRLAAPAASFTFHSALRTASVSPPAPFSGSAHFHRNAAPANRWTGDLSVDLPGRDGVPLAGAGLHPRLTPAG